MKPQTIQIIINIVFSVALVEIALFEIAILSRIRTPDVDSICIHKELTVRDVFFTVRMRAFVTPDEDAGLQLFDKDGIKRFEAATRADGQTSVTWLDKDGKSRIAAGIDADGLVVLPTKDRNPPKKP